MRRAQAPPYGKAQNTGPTAYCRAAQATTTPKLERRAGAAGAARAPGAAAAAARAVAARAGASLRGGGGASKPGQHAKVRCCLRRAVGAASGAACLRGASGGVSMGVQPSARRVAVCVPAL